MKPDLISIPMYLPQDFSHSIKMYFELDHSLALLTGLSMASNCPWDALVGADLLKRHDDKKSD